MHRAPPVSYPANNTPVKFVPVCIVWALGLAVAAFWLVSSKVDATSAAFAAALVLLAGILALRSVATLSPTHLQWDGKAWTCSSDGPDDTGEMWCVLDLQRLMLLHWRSGHGPTRWFWVLRSGPREPWDSFRRAVVDTTGPS